MALQALYVMTSCIKDLTTCTRQQLKVTDRSCMFYHPYVYVLDISERMRLIAHHLGIGTVFKSSNTLRWPLVQVKNHIPPENHGMVYESLCKDC